MTHFSLKRTLQSSLLSTYSLAHENGGKSPEKALVIPDSLSLSGTSIRKITQACHRQKLVKKTSNTENITYISAILRKPSRSFSEPIALVAEGYARFLNRQEASTAVPMFEVSSDTNGMVIFTILGQGVLVWRQRLESWPLAGKPTVTAATSLAATAFSPGDLWQLQSAYEWCCRCCRCWRQQSQPCESGSSPPEMGRLPYDVPASGAALIHLMVELCDAWEELSPAQLRRYGLQLAEAAADTSRLFTLGELSQGAAPAVGAWLESARSLLGHLLLDRLGLLPVRRF